MCDFSVGRSIMRQVRFRLARARTDGTLYHPKLAFGDTLGLAGSSFGAGALPVLGLMRLKLSEPRS